VKNNGRITSEKLALNKDTAKDENKVNDLVERILKHWENGMSLKEAIKKVKGENL
jgi:hypothetical protein